MEEDNRQDKQEAIEPKQEDGKSSSKKAISFFVAIDILLVIIIIILLCLKSCKDNNEQESNNNNKEPEIDLVRFNKITDVFKGIVKKNMEFNLYTDDPLDKVIAVSYIDNYPNNFTLNISVTSATKVYYCTVTDYSYDGNKEEYNNFLDYLLLDTTSYKVGSGIPNLNSTLISDIKIETSKSVNKYIISENEHDPTDKYIDGFYLDNNEFHIYQNESYNAPSDPFIKASKQVITSGSPLYDYYQGLLAS